ITASNSANLLRWVTRSVSPPSAKCRTSPTVASTMKTSPPRSLTRAMVPAQPYASSSACGTMTSSRCWARKSSLGTISLTLLTAWPRLAPPAGGRGAGAAVLDDAADDLVQVPPGLEADQPLDARDVRDPAPGVLVTVAVRLPVRDVPDGAAGPGQCDHPFGEV